MARKAGGGWSSTGKKQQGGVHVVPRTTTALSSSMPSPLLTSATISTIVFPTMIQLTNQPAQALEEEHPSISTYLHSLSPDYNTNSTAQIPTDPNEVSALAVDNYTSAQTSDLLAQTRVIMEQCERDGTDPDERLREVVERAVREGFNFGGQLGDAAAGGAGGEVAEAEVKRSREDGA